jgi:hypothetical protein
MVEAEPLIPRDLIEDGAGWPVSLGDGRYVQKYPHALQY